jgi:sterol desaturase/sphingolipid hydroxylase (fatty acid hydroxylase superfamily)
MSSRDSTAWYALGVPAYLLVMGLEHLLARRRGQRLYRFGDTLGNLAAGLGEVTLGLFLGPLLVALYDWGYTHLALVRWPEGSPVPWVLAFALGDLGYWVYHRAGHRVAALWAIHGVHHQSPSFNASVAIRHPWLSDTYAALFYAPLPLAGVNATQFFVAISVISFYAFTVHTQVFHRPGLGILVTPRTHIVHHAQNPRYRGRNLGAMFTVWDRLFGTHVEVDPSDPPELTPRGGYRSHDGALCQLLGWTDLAALARQTPRWTDKLRVFLKPPGWLPPGATRPVLPTAREDRDIPPAVRGYALAQFTAVVLLAVDTLWRREHHPLAVQLPVAVLTVWGIASVGALLDGRSYARALEGSRLLGLLAAGAWLALGCGRPWVGALLALGALGSLGALPSLRGSAVARSDA